MFVKIIRGSHEQVIECTAVSIDSSRCKKENKFMLFIEGLNRRVVNHEIDKTVPEALGVYLMNSKGQTIDTVFSKQPD